MNLHAVSRAAISFAVGRLLTKQGCFVCVATKQGCFVHAKFGGGGSMRIVNPRVRQAIEAGDGLCLNLGCGKRQREGFFGIDRVELPNVDIVADLNEPLDQLPDGSVEQIFTRHTLEHVEKFMPLMTELHRIMRPNGQIEISVPHFSNPYGYSDPTHVRLFGLYTFFYFADEADQPRRKVPSFYAAERFTVESIRIQLLKPSLLFRPLTSSLEWFINRSIALQDWYERAVCRSFPADSIRFVLKVKKAAAGLHAATRRAA
jgi:Methyltransferase domain